MQRDIRKGHGIAIDVEGADGIGIIAVFLGLLQLAAEELGEV
jgi:hypothetical protein